MALDEILASDQPYFGDFMIAKQGPYEDYLPHFKNLAEMAGTSVHTGITILEVGSWAGGSLAVWDKATNGCARFIVVEQWKPYLNDPHSECHSIIDQAARNGSIEKLFWHNMKMLGIEKRIKLYRGDSKERLSSIPPAPAGGPGGVDIAFIDADHRYASAKGDIEAAMPLVRDGGILCGDDLQVQFHELAPDDVIYTPHEKLLAENALNGHLPDGRFYHPGVTQAVAELFGPVPTAGRLWAVQKVGSTWNPVEF